MADQLTKVAQKNPSVLSRKSFTAAEEQIMGALTKMAIMRGAATTPIYLKVFAERLSTERFTDVIRALSTLAERSRREGEAALPDIGTILDYVHKRGSYIPGPLVDTRSETIAELAARNGADPSYVGEIPERLRPKTNAEKLEAAGWEV